jgi:hypothetical protein
MGRFRAAFVLVLTCSVPAMAAELPTRKAGLWEVKTTNNGRTVSIQQCVDAKTDEAMQASVASAPQRGCAKRDVQKSGDTTTIDSTCTVAGKTVTRHMVITGSFDSGYTMTITAQGDGIPVPRNTNMTAKWVGGCAADQKPGDVIMPNGTKINMLDAQKRAGQLGAPLPPATSPAR